MPNSINVTLAHGSSTAQTPPAGTASAGIGVSRSPQLHPADGLVADVTPWAAGSAGSLHDGTDLFGNPRLHSFEQRHPRIAQWAQEMSSVGAGTEAFTGSVSGNGGPPTKDEVLLALCHAARNGEHGLVTELIDRHTDLAPTDLGTVLHAAAEGGHLALMNVLVLERGAFDTADEHGVTALRKAIEFVRTPSPAPQAGPAAFGVHPDSDALQSLRRHLLPEAALAEAAALGDVDKFLAAWQWPAGAVGLDEMSEALHEAVKRGYLSVVQGLLDRGTPPDREDERLMTPLHHALEHGHPEIVRALMAHSAVTDSPDGRGTWASQKAADFAARHPDDLEARQISQLLRDLREGQRQFFAQAGLDAAAVDAAERLMEHLPRAARQGQSTSATLCHCAVLAQDFRSSGRGMPLSRWAQTLGLEARILTLRQRQLLACWDELIHQGRMPPEARSPQPEHLRKPGFTAVLMTDFQIATLVHQGADALLPFDDVHWVQGILRSEIDTTRFNQAKVLAAGHYLKRLPFASLRAELHAECQREGRVPRPDLLATYRLVAGCLMLADQHLSPRPLASAAWCMPLDKTAAEVNAFREKLLTALGHDLTVPGPASP